MHSQPGNSLKFWMNSLYPELWEMPLLKNKKTQTSSQHSHWEALQQKVQICIDCDLYTGRKKSTLGKGNLGAKILILGDFPSDDDNRSGAIFSDSSGDLLDKMILAMCLKPDDTFVSTIFKCKPPHGFVWTENFSQKCLGYLREQISCMPQLKFILCMGQIPSQILFRSGSPLPVLRGQEGNWENLRLFATHHPKDLLLDTGKKKEAWQDLKFVMRNFK